MRSVVACLTFAIAMSTGALAGMKGGHELSDEELRTEIGQNRALAAYVARNGMPDVAEWHFLADRPPWDDHEVTLYYLDARTKISFARASILGRPEIQLIRYQRTLSDEEAAALAPRAGGRQTGTRSADDPPDPPVLGSAGTGPAADQPPLDQPPLAQPDQLDPPVGGPAERAEAAAGRAEAAADRLEAAADSAEEAAGRAEAVTARVVSAHSASR